MSSPATICKAAIIYFLIVFGVGFILGPIRIMWIVPQLGQRVAELLEAPVMLAVILLAARMIVRRYGTEVSIARRLWIGSLALAFLIVAEFSFVLSLRRISIAEYFASRDPVAAGVYYVMLLFFAAAPALVGRSS